MSRVYTIEATLNLDGDEQDYPVRAHVAYESQRGGCWGGSVDGDVEAFVFDAWVSLDDLNVDAHDRGRIEEALADACSNDDRDADRYAS